MEVEKVIFVASGQKRRCRFSFPRGSFFVPRQKYILFDYFGYRDTLLIRADNILGGFNFQCNAGGNNGCCDGTFLLVVSWNWFGISVATPDVYFISAIQKPIMFCASTLCSCIQHCSIFFHWKFCDPPFFLLPAAHLSDDTLPKITHFPPVSSLVSYSFGRNSPGTGGKC